MSLKMQWLIDCLNGGPDNRPAGAKETTDWMINHQRGLIIAPTGYGKSGIIFYYIVQRLRDAIEKQKKLVFTLSTPLLVLNDQFYCDMIEVLTNLSGQPLTKDNCIFVENSSDESRQRGIVDPVSRIPRCGMYELKTALNKGSTLPDFIFIISTHKSYNTLLAEEDNYILGQFRTIGYETITMFDESHTITNGSLTKKEEAKERLDNREEKNDLINMDALDKYADCIYMISATPPKWQAEWLKEHP